MNIGVELIILSHALHQPQTIVLQTLTCVRTPHSGEERNVSGLVQEDKEEDVLAPSNIASTQLT